MATAWRRGFDSSARAGHDDMLTVFRRKIPPVLYRTDTADKAHPQYRKISLKTFTYVIRLTRLRLFTISLKIDTGVSD